MSLDIVAWDVEHGSATYIKTPNGKHIVVDLGVGSYENKNETFSPLLHLKNKWNVKQLDMVVISHPHGDHIKDIMNFDALNPRVLHRPKHLSEEDIQKAARKEEEDIVKKYFEINKKYSQPMDNSVNPYVPDNMGGAKIQTFTPTECGTSNINNHSIVTVVSYATSKIVISGDNEPASWKELFGQNGFIDAIKNADILVAPHHGRDSGFCSELFEYFNPSLTIISDGRFCDTSATDRYCKVTNGWEVTYRNDTAKETRKCVTTRNDGYVVVNFGYNGDNQTRPYITVRAKGK
ncbi:MAG: ComEC/Rec2 family competence protein [Candidatus Bathyarchaeia archaeon]|jgi:competence protein ComEC